MKLPRLFAWSFTLLFFTVSAFGQEYNARVFTVLMGSGRLGNEVRLPSVNSVDQLVESVYRQVKEGDTLSFIKLPLGQRTAEEFAGLMRSNGLSAQFYEVLPPTSPLLPPPVDKTPFGSNRTPVSGGLLFGKPYEVDVWRQGYSRIAIGLSVAPNRAPSPVLHFNRSELLIEPEDARSLGFLIEYANNPGLRPVADQLARALEERVAQLVRSPYNSYEEFSRSQLSYPPVRRDAGAQTNQTGQAGGRLKYVISIAN